MSVGLKLHPSLSGISTCPPVFTVTLSADYIHLFRKVLISVQRAPNLGRLKKDLGKKTKNL